MAAGFAKSQKPSGQSGRFARRRVASRRRILRLTHRRGWRRLRIRGKRKRLGLRRVWKNGVVGGGRGKVGIRLRQRLTRLRQLRAQIKAHARSPISQVLESKQRELTTNAGLVGTACGSGRILSLAIPARYRGQAVPTFYCSLCSARCTSATTKRIMR